MENDKQRLVELFEQLEDPSLTCPRMGTNARCEGCKYLKGNGCDLTERFVDYFLANGVIVPPVKIKTKVYKIFQGKIYEYEVASYTVDADGFSFIHLAYMEGNTIYGATHSIEEFNKQYYFTKEEALNNVQNGNSCEGGAE